MKMKQNFTRILALLLVLCLLFSGCSTRETQEAGNQVTELPATPSANEGESAGAGENTPDLEGTPAGTSFGVPAETGDPGEAETPLPNTTSPAGTNTPDKTVTKSPNKTPAPTVKPSANPFDPEIFKQNKPNQYKSYPSVSNITSGISWPSGQALPIFAAPAATMDTISVANLTEDEQLAFSAFQGIVNKKQPRVYLLDENPDEGALTWANTPTVNLKKRNTYNKAKRYDLIKKYAGELKGVILYSTVKSPHYRNLASTVANIKGAIPVTSSVYNSLKANGIHLTVLVDLTTLQYTNAVDIYNYMYNQYWKSCEKRLIISSNPQTDYHHTRDIAAATGAAVVYLDCMNSSQKAVFQKFLGDMKAGQALVMGWYSSERSGIATATGYGIGTIPADFYISGTVYGGTDHKIQIPAVPNKPNLENKVYVAVYLSDGDNIQYTQRAMRKFWDEYAPSRGRVAMNWTISPALVDIGPGLLNYYYTNSTSKECFVAGPSGLGYLLPYNTLQEAGAPVGNNLTNISYMNGYTSLTETYLQRAGLRVLTIWDNATTDQRKSYAKNCRYLYGATVQHFQNKASVSGSVVDGRIRFDKMVSAYEGSYSNLYYSIANQIRNWNGNSPLFLSYQVDIWNEMKPDRIVQLYNQLKSEFPNQFEFIRADHFFALYNEANQLPFNLSMSAKTSVTASDSSVSPNRVKDGTPVTLWSSSKAGEKWLKFDLGGTYKLSRYVIRHAGENGMQKNYNTRAYRVQISTNGTSWSTIDTYKENQSNVTDIQVPAVSARYVRILIDDPGTDGVARIADVELYGTRS